MSPKDRQPRLDAAQLAALLVETLVIGVFYVLLIPTFEAIRFRAKTRQETLFRPTTFCALALVVTITVKWIVDIVRAFSAFLLDGSYCVFPGEPNPAEIAFSRFSNLNSVAGSVMYTLTTILGDGFMIYRLWVVWRRNKLIVFPPILLLWGIAISGILVACHFGKDDIRILASDDVVTYILRVSILYAIKITA
ncbi:hypothetical protein CPB83DRAFT_898523 [Crepidotus variabilis]|uniref:Uncharacterized protein n=1 Tax=Crepidotus variabilis TaxID=179855 RepID=A0A9P6E7F9_9AGAR|nr:hypothetical protein CPB83DRAFT_898523 [Crepidotus variabilis]